MGFISTYSASLYTGGTQSNLQYNAIINCYNESQMTPVMTAYFYHEGYFIPPNSKHVDRVNLRYSISEYEHFLNLLRNEKPVFFCFNEHTKVGYIRTGHESTPESQLEKTSYSEGVEQNI